MEHKEIKLLSISDVLVETAQHLGTAENTNVGRFLLAANSEIGINRIRNLLALYAKTDILTYPNTSADAIDEIVSAFTTIATYFDFQDSDEFDGYIHLILAQKGLSSKFLGLLPIHQSTVLSLEHVGTILDTMHGTEFDKIGMVSFIIANIEISDDDKNTALSLCMEMFSMISQEHNVAMYDEIKTALDMLRFRLNPDGDEGTVDIRGVSHYIVWTEQTPANDDDVSSATPNAGKSDQGKSASAAV